MVAFFQVGLVAGLGQVPGAWGPGAGEFIHARENRMAAAGHPARLRSCPQIGVGVRVDVPEAAEVLRAAYTAARAAPEAVTAAGPPRWLAQFAQSAVCWRRPPWGKWGTV